MSTELNSTQLQKLVKQNKVGFIALAISKWHAIGVEAWFLEYQRTGDTRGGIVIMVPHPSDGMLLNSGDFPLLENNPNVMIRTWTPINKTEHLCHLFGKMLILFSTALIKQKTSSKPTMSFIIPNKPSWGIALRIGALYTVRKLQIRFVILDEGVGSYMPKSIWQQVYILDSKNSSISWHTKLLTLAKNIPRETANWLGNQHDLEERYLFQLKNNFLIPKVNLANDYRDVISFHARNTTLKRGIKPIAVFITQPWSELDQINHKVEVFIIQQAIDSAIKKGFQILIKLHPREIEGKYNAIVEAINSEQISILNTSFAVENIFSLLGKNDIVIGFTSTALVTASALFNIKSYTIGIEALSEESVGSIFKESYIIFRKITSNLITDFSKEI